MNQQGVSNSLNDIVDLMLGFLRVSLQTQIYLQLHLWGLICYGFLLSWQFWQALAALPENYPKDHQSPGFEPI